MPISVKISLCKITSASKLFQRNYYLPLLKPLSPQDAMRRKIISGQNVLGNRVEHYIPVLTTQDEKSAERRKRGKGVPVIKKRVKRREDERFLEPFFDDDMENHSYLQSILNRKPKGKGQRYTYEVPDKKCTLVISHQMEKAIKDKDIIDLVIAQRSERVVVKLSKGMKVTMPLANYNEHVPLYRGSGFTKEVAEQEHHHGKETMSIAKLFEARESGVQEWELDMMRMANKRKKKVKGEDSKDWKTMMSGVVQDMDWNKFDEDTKQIVDEEAVIVADEDIPMEVDDMEKTRNVAEKLRIGGTLALEQLPLMSEIPEVIKKLETGEMYEMLDVSGVKLKLANGKTCFVTGQMVKTDDNSVFVPGQTIETEEGDSEYTPGITVYMDDDAVLIPGLVMGEEESPAMFLPGESTITEGGQLVFESTDEDRNRVQRTPSPSPPPKPKKEEEIVIRRRVIEEPEEEPPRRERKVIALDPILTPPMAPRVAREECQIDARDLEEALLLVEEQRRKREEEERKRQKERLEEKMLKEEAYIDKIRTNIRKKCKDLVIEQPLPYVPFQPVKKSQQLEAFETSIRRGTFFEDGRTNDILERARTATRMSKYQYVLEPYANKVEKIRH